MSRLEDFKNQIHKCSRCGLCQSACPLYQISGNDCTVSRGQFIMLDGVLKNELKLNKNINKYLDLCLKCGACSKFCPSGIDAVDIIIAAKSEYFKSSLKERLISVFQKYILFGIVPKLIGLFVPKTKSEVYETKVLYFGGCGSRFKSDKAIVKVLNRLNIEVINPDFDCCGISLFTRGDLEGFQKAIDSYVNILKKYNITNVVTNCASCEKSLKDYIKWTTNEEHKKFLSTVVVRNVFSYIKESGLGFELEKSVRVTYHKPCNINNFEDIEWVLKNTKNLEYIEMENFDKCCGLNAVTKIRERKIVSALLDEKSNNIKKTLARYVLTSCLGCQVALSFNLTRKYKVMDLLEFLARN
ncbi:(Fe-S)-binding protein [bacterium]|nr:(Fe-S)-binding protein [bacterium]